MVAINTILHLLAITGATAILIARDNLQNLQTIDGDLQRLTTAVNAYNGGLTSAVAVQNTESTLENDLKSGCNGFKASPTMSSADCRSLANYLSNTIEPDCRKCANAIQSKKASFQSSGLYNTVCTDCQNIKQGFDCICNALISTCPASLQASVASVCRAIDADWNNCCAGSSAGTAK